MTHLSSKAERLSVALLECVDDSPWLTCNVAKMDVQAAAALLRRIPELEADYKRLMDKHNALHVNALGCRQRITQLEAERKGEQHA